MTGRSPVGNLQFYCNGSVVLYSTDDAHKNFKGQYFSFFHSCLKIGIILVDARVLRQAIHICVVTLTCSTTALDTMTLIISM